MSEVSIGARGKGRTKLKYQQKSETLQIQWGGCKNACGAVACHVDTSISSGTPSIIPTHETNEFGGSSVQVPARIILAKTNIHDRKFKRLDRGSATG
jgi:5-methylcytosine-specific restriction endonuclease McrA